MKITLTPEARNHIHKKGGDITLSVLTVGG